MANPIIINNSNIVNIIMYADKSTNYYPLLPWFSTTETILYMYDVAVQRYGPQGGPVPEHHHLIQRFSPGANPIVVACHSIDFWCDYHYLDTDLMRAQVTILRELLDLETFGYEANEAMESTVRKLTQKIWMAIWGDKE